MKNMDPLNDNIVVQLQSSSDGFTREIWKDGQLAVFLISFLYSKSLTIEKHASLDNTKKHFLRCSLGR